MDDPHGGSAGRWPAAPARSSRHEVADRAAPHLPGDGGPARRGRGRPRDPRDSAAQPPVREAGGVPGEGGEVRPSRPLHVPVREHDREIPGVPRLRHALEVGGDDHHRRRG
eukprot:6191428-Lingulodinium_polyedra.AAC.1